MLDTDLIADLEALKVMQARAPLITHRIVFTAYEDGSVRANCPTPEIFEVMERGGWWDSYPRGYIDVQIGRMVADGIAVDHASRFARAVAYGGIGHREVWEIIRDRDLHRLGHDFMIMPGGSLPSRWFREAWRRNHNGGVVIDLGLARPIQFNRLVAAVEDYNRDAERPSYPMSWRKKAIRVDWEAVETAVNRCGSVDELARIWHPDVAVPRYLQELIG